MFPLSDRELRIALISAAAGVGAGISGHGSPIKTALYGATYFLVLSHFFGPEGGSLLPEVHAPALPNLPGHPGRPEMP